MTRRHALAVLLGASAWTDSVVVYAGQPPRLSMAFGGDKGFSGLEVTIGDETFVISPEELADGLRRVPGKLER